MKQPNEVFANPVGRPRENQSDQLIISGPKGRNVRRVRNHLREGPLLREFQFEDPQFVLLRNLFDLRDAG